LLLPFFEWCDGLAMSQAYRDSTYLFPVTQALHILAVTVFVGAIVIGDLRLLGWGPVGESRASIARSAQRILLWAGLAVLVTGIRRGTPAVVGAEGRRRRIARAVDGCDDQRQVDHLLRLIVVSRSLLRRRRVL
jgi:hypothetical protein